MDNFETDSNCSYHSDSLQSYESNLSGLSLYKNEFVELRHLVNPLTYSDNTSNPCLNIENNNTFKNKLQSCELNNVEHLERKAELKYSEKIETLLKSNNKLESDLENANNQIERLIRNYNGNQNIDLEKKNSQLTSDLLKLQQFTAKIQQEKSDADLENKNLKIKLNELTTDIDIKNNSIRILKLEISKQHVDVQNYLKTNKDLTEKLNFLNTKFEESEKFKNWYKEQLIVYKTEQIKLKEEINKLNELKDEVSSLNINLVKHKNEIEDVQLKALKEKQELYEKLEKINLDHNVPIKTNNDYEVTNNSIDVNDNFYKTSIEDLKVEIAQIKAAALKKDQEFDKIKQENFNLMSKYLILQKTLKQKEFDIELLECNKKELMEKLKFLQDNENEKLNTNLHLKNKLSSLEIELKMRNQEKMEVEKSVQLIRDQVEKFKDNYRKIKDELAFKNKEILQLEKVKQELFMNHSWTVCELEKMKQKDRIIEGLRKDGQENDHKILSLEKENEKYRYEMKNKDKLIFEVKRKLRKFENDWEHYVKRITDDEKVKLLNSQKNPTTTTDIEKFINNSFEKLNIDEFENTVNIRINYLDERIQKIQNKAVTIQEKLDDNPKQNKIKELEILLQVKEREMDEKQTKMDRNNRTLLRKVKEHMRGRNSAEKQLKYLQDLYDSLADHNNKLKLTITSKDVEIEVLQEASNTYKIDIEKLQNTIKELEIELAKTNNCYNNEAKKLLNKQTLTESIISKLKEDLKEAAEKVNYLCAKEKIQSSNIQQKVEYSKELEAQISKLQNDHEYFKKTINVYENRINLLQNNIKTLNDANFFLQRLSSDLKLALKSNVEHNMTLQQQLDLLKTKKQPMRKLTMDILDECNLYDEKYINNLLERHRSSVGKLMDKGMHDCLGQLRQGIFNLQDQISKKNSGV